MDVEEFCYVEVSSRRPIPVSSLRVPPVSWPVVSIVASRLPDNQLVLAHPSNGIKVLAVRLCMQLILCPFYYCIAHHHR